MAGGKVYKIILCSIVVSITGSVCFGQEDPTKINYDTLSLKDLLDVKIMSVSKKTESLFDAPLSASVLTKTEIQRAGCTSIMEALRLVPGMIVREQTNGNYDIHIRGMDNVPPNAPFDVTSNTTTLVMIDNRPVYSYLRGGTFWETLPVDLNDVEKIEVIRGPAAALYGPNAVNGVINIITRHADRPGINLQANSQQGSYQTFINNISLGYRFNEKWSVLASANHQSRDRSQTSYYELDRNEWITAPPYFLDFTGDTIRNVATRYPDQAMSMDKSGGNIFLNYTASDKIKFGFSTGLQHSVVQRVSTENEITPLSVESSDSRYADFRATVNGLSAQLSYDGGVQSTDDDPGRKYNFTIAGGNIEYNYIRGHLSVKPGLSYSSAVYDDRKYSNVLLQTGLFNGRGQLTTRSASLRGEYTLLENKVRLVAGIAGSRFNYPDTTYFSYEFAATYKPGKNSLFRAAVSRAPRSANIFDTYVSKTLSDAPSGINSFTRVTAEGNNDLPLLTAGMLELGYRGNISPGLSIDVELFNIRTKNYSTPVYSRPFTQITGIDTITVVPVRPTTLPLSLVQQGLTVSLTYHSKQWEINPFITLQHTLAKDDAPFQNTPDAATAGAAQNNIYSGIGNRSTLKSTPAFFGGASVNYIFSSRLNLNLNTYFYTSQVYEHVSNLIFRDGVRGIDHIRAKFILNVTATYEAAKGLHLFCSGKNLLNDNSREFFRTDAVPLMVLGGLKYDFQR